jgi:hypothetical protein
VAVPRHREKTEALALRELGAGKLDVILAAALGGPRDVAVREDDARRLREMLALSDQGVLADAGRADDVEKTAGHPTTAARSARRRERR